MKPADLLDLDLWRLQLPIETAHAGTPDLYDPAELEAGFDVSPWFVALDTASAVQFRANVEGVPVTGTTYPRSELREMASASTVAAWSGSTGRHVLEARLAVTQRPNVNQQVVCAAIHNGTTDGALQILFDAGKIRWRYGGATQAEILINSYTLGTAFTVRIEVVDGTTTLSLNGSQIATRSGLGGAANQFRVGAMPLSTTASDASGQYGEVLLYSLYLQHGTDPAGVFYRNRSLVDTAVSGASTALPVPVGIRPTDRMYALVLSIATNPTVTGPTGWTKVGEFTTGTTLKTALYYRTVDGTEAASYTWSWSGNGRTMGMLGAYGGVDLTATVAASATGGVDSAAPLAASFGTVPPGAWAVYAAAGRESPGTDNAKSWTINSSSDAERVDNYSSNTGTGADVTGAWYDTAGPAGTSIDRSVTPNVALSHYHLWPFLLPPAVSPDVNPWTSVGLVPIR